MSVGVFMLVEDEDSFLVAVFAEAVGALLHIEGFSGEVVYPPANFAFAGDGFERVVFWFAHSVFKVWGKSRITRKMQATIRRLLCVLLKSCAHGA